jgi:[NiFe] hydrogenase assembly HybE family chaperone
VNERVMALQALFERIAATRMQGVPMLHPGLKVQAVGFEPEPGRADEPSPGSAAVGVLVTPWFMNLVWLPLGDEAAAAVAAVGQTRTRAVGCERFGFIGAQEDGFGAYEACSLFSPMFEFVDQAAAVATARAVLAELRRPPEPVKPPPVVASRRALLFGRGASPAAGAAA